MPFKKKSTVNMKSSASMLANNLSAVGGDRSGNIDFAAVHKSVVNLVLGCGSSDYRTKQVISKEGSGAHSPSIILQAKLLQLARRKILVICCQRGIQMFEGDGSTLLYFHSTGDSTATGMDACFTRGVAAVDGHTVAVGTHEGLILVFSVPDKGCNVALEETLKGHRWPITDLHSNEEVLVSADEDGTMCVWVGDRLRQAQVIKGTGWPATSIGMYGDFIVAGYGSGHLRVFHAPSGSIVAEATAHARAINAVDVSPRGLVLSVSGDSYAQLWQIKDGSHPELVHRQSEQVEDMQLVGGVLTESDGSVIMLTAYDSPDIIVYSD